jgi:hypothetical protein
MGSWEAFWRSRGFLPSIVNNPALWAMMRKEASNAGPDAVVLVGSSRMMLAINPDAFVSATGWSKPIQLAIPMGASIPVLTNLSEDPSFSGKVICEVNPLAFFDSSRLLDHISKGYIAAYSSFSWADGIEERLKLALQQTLVSRLPALYPKQLRNALINGRWPRPDHIRTTPDRFGQADFRRLEHLHSFIRMTAFQRSRMQWLRHPYTGNQLAELIRTLNQSVMKIRDRGGDVVFVRLPSTAHILEDETRWYPRQRYWDVFAEKSIAATIHFEDYPELSQFRPPDGEHLDARDTIMFSRALGKILLEKIQNGHAP